MRPSFLFPTSLIPNKDKEVEQVAIAPVSIFDEIRIVPRPHHSCDSNALFFNEQLTV